MNWEHTNLQKRLYLIGAIILLIGLSSALLIFLTAEDNSESGVGNEVADESVYQVTPENSKMYTHDLELFGGKSAVLANEFRIWFDGLWQGKSLAFSVAGITLILFLGVIFVARHSKYDTDPGVRDENSRDATG